MFDQFCGRFNQFFFGYFVGQTLYSLLILATVDEPHNPIFGAALAVDLTAVALFSLLILLYMTVDQMRPAVIIRAVHNHTITAYERHQDFLRDVRAGVEADDDISDGGPSCRHLVQAREYGFVVRSTLGRWPRRRIMQNRSASSCAQCRLVRRPT